MNVECEIILPDEGSSFRLLHTKTKAEQFPWQYHYHPEYEIVCVLQGGGTRHVGNHFSNYEKGDLVFIGPNLPHAGFGLGFERMVQFVTGMSNIRDVIAFPRTPGNAEF